MFSTSQSIYLSGSVTWQRMFTSNAQSIIRELVFVLTEQSLSIRPMVDTVNLNDIYDFDSRMLIGASFLSLSVIITLLFFGYKHYINGKPLGFQTIMDLLHVDLAFIYMACTWSFCFSAGFKALYSPPFPHYLALVIAWGAGCWFYALWIYLSVASLVRYIIVYHSWLLEKLNKSDHVVQLSLYYSTLFVATFLATFCTLFNTSNEFYPLYTNQWENCGDYCAPPHYDKTITLGLIVLTASINGTIKFILWREKNRNLSHNSNNLMEFVATAIIAFFVACSAVYLVSVGRHDDKLITRLFVCSNLVITVPSLIFVTNAKMRKTACHRIRQFWNRLFGFRHANQICPA